MGKSELQTALSDWNKRVAKYASSGIPQDVYMPIAQSDFQKTYTNDSQPMTNLEADLAVYSAANKTQPLQQTPRHSENPLGTIISNIIPDATNIITGLPRGLYDTAKEIVTPSTYKTIGADIGKVASGRAGNLGGDLRTLAGAPLLNLIPGLSDAAALTTSAGRESLLEHPITATADVTPFLGPVSKLAAAPALAGLSDADRAALASSPSALAAAADGRPILFGLRAADRQLFTRAALSGYLGDTIKLLAQRAQAAGEDPYFQVRGLQPGHTLGLGQYSVRRVAQRTNLDALGKQVSTAVSRQMGDVYRTSDEYKQRLNKIYEPIIKEGGARALGRFSAKIRAGDFSDLTAVQQAALPAIRQVEAEIRARGLQSGALAETDVGVYSAESAPAKWFARLQTSHQQVTDAEAALDAELAKTAEMSTVPTPVRTITDKRGRTYQRGGSPRTMPSVSVTTPDIAATGGRAVPFPIGKYTRTVPKREHEAAVKLKQAKAAQKAALRRYQKAYLRNPPPLLHPVIKAKMREIVEQDYRARRNVAADPPTDTQISQAYSQGKLDEFSQAIKDIQHNPALDKLKSYMGDKEWKQAWTDLVNTTIKQSREGLSPVYFHDISEQELKSGSVFHVSLIKDKGQDVTEGAYKEKAFGISTGSTFNVYAGQVQAGMESIARDGMTHLHSQYLTPLTKTHDDLYDFYLKIAEQSYAKRTQQSLQGYATALMNREWTAYDFSNGGFRWDVQNPRTSTTYLPRDVAKNLQSFGKGNNRLFSSTIYRGGMKLFRTSVLYGPRHFAHIVIGGMFPIALAHPGAFIDLIRAFPAMRSLFAGNEHDVMTAMPALYKHPSNWTLDNALDLHVGYKMGSVLKEYWNKTGVRLSDGMKRFEDMAQSMYQYAVFANQIRHGVDPEAALEEGRRMVVNLDSMSPFERTIMKQLMPFYAFTRFALMYMLRFPMDHPIRYSMLTQIGSQAAEEWQHSGLPMDMMSLIYFGKPTKSGNVFTVNYRNVNPFRSVFNVFTFGGFLSSLNPAISSAFAFTGGDVLSGTGSLYPKLAVNSQTGGVAASRPPGDFLGAAEQFVPELSWPDLWLQVSSKVKTTDPQAFQRALWSSANLPFTPSSYNIPTQRAKESTALYQVAQQAVSEYTHSLNTQGSINRFPLIPFQSHLYTPKQFETYYQSLAKQYEKLYPGIDPKALIPSSSIG